MKLNGKKIFLSGAGGFIGSHLCETLLNRGLDVTAMIHYTSRPDWANLEFLPIELKKGIRVVAGDIRDGDWVTRNIKGHDVVFHLAALIGIPFSYTAPLSYVRTNIEGTLNVLEACRHWEVERIIHTSTSETYGTALYTPIDEDHPLQGQSPYSATKIGADKLAESYFRSFGSPVVTVRPFNCYGPRQSARAVIPTAISQALLRPEIRLGSLEPIRDFTYVTDTVEAFLTAAETDSAIGNTLNVSTGVGVSIRTVTEMVNSVLNSQKPVVQETERLRPEQSEVMALIGNSEKLRRLTGWSPKYPLELGIKQTSEFIRSNLGVYKPEMYAL